MDFYDLDLSDGVLDALDAMNFTDTTPIQEPAIPPILEGRDIIGVAQTGTGKTAAYLLPVLSMLEEGDYPKDAINCIIMAPTRELAQQIDQAMQGFSYYLDGVSPTSCQCRVLRYMEETMASAMNKRNVDSSLAQASSLPHQDD